MRNLITHLCHVFSTLVRTDARKISDKISNKSMREIQTHAQLILLAFPQKNADTLTHAQTEQNNLKRLSFKVPLN